MRTRSRICVTVALNVLVPNLGHAQATRPRFEVASIKRNTSCGLPRPGGRLTPGRFDVECTSLQTLVENAYYVFADGESLNPKSIDISGGPSWMVSEAYHISAKAEDGATPAQMAGPMMQSLLEERFKLKLHRAPKEGPVYFLTVAKGGPKMEQTKEGTCVTIDLKHPLTRVPGEPRPSICGSRGMNANDRGMITMSASGITTDLLANDVQLTRFVGLPIIDKTGLSGRLDFSIEFAPATAKPVASGEAAVTPALPAAPAGSSIFEALEQLGLKLEAGKGSVEILIIDHLERPTEN